MPPFLFLLSSPAPTFHSLLAPSSLVDSTSGEEWSAWSVCSATCGEGWQSRTRFCVSSSYSTQCSGPLREQRPCNNSAVCPGKSPLLHSPCPISFQHLPNLSLTLPDPQIMYLSQIGGICFLFTPIIMTNKSICCGSVIKSEKWLQSNGCIIFQCPYEVIPCCSFAFWGPVFIWLILVLAALLAVHAVWDEWSPWSLCSSTCGRGYRSRTRTCTPPQFGGDPCDGPEKQTKFCNIAVCPGEENTQLKRENDNKKLCFTVILCLCCVIGAVTLSTISGWILEWVVQLEFLLGLLF